MQGKNLCPLSHSARLTPYFLKKDLLLNLELLVPIDGLVSESRDPPVSMQGWGYKCLLLNQAF